MQTPINVTASRGGFSAALDAFEAAVARCDFLAFDTELSGLHTTAAAAPAATSGSADAIPTRYAKVRASAEAFAVLQLGIAAFRWRLRRRRSHHPPSPAAAAADTDDAHSDDTNGGRDDDASDDDDNSTDSGPCYMADVFCFPVALAATPAGRGGGGGGGRKGGGVDRVFCMQAASFEFLASNGFDFNSWIAD
ncbi:hypothetical protein HK405_001216, partial [Cladochytrium tenue]